MKRIFLSAGPKSDDKIAVREAVLGFATEAFLAGVELHCRYQPAISPLLVARWNSTRARSKDAALRVFAALDGEVPGKESMVAPFFEGKALALADEPHYPLAVFIGGGPDLWPDWLELRGTKTKLAPVAQTEGDAKILHSEGLPRIAMNFEAALCDLLERENVYDHLARKLFAAVFRAS